MPEPSRADPGDGPRRQGRFGLPGGQGTTSGGERAMVPVLARAAVAIGVAAVFMETHEDPDHAPSDGPNMLNLKDVPGLLAELIELDRIAKKRIMGHA